MINELNILISRALDKDYAPNIERFDDPAKVIELINTRFSSAFDAALNNKLILRGTSLKGACSVLTPGTRVSQNTSNIYTILMSNILPGWKDYPKRNRSFICTNDKSKANKYRSQTYLMLPCNNSRIAICPENDIWFSFEFVKSLDGWDIPNMMRFNENLSNLLSIPASLNLEYWHENEDQYPLLQKLYTTKSWAEINKRISVDTFFTYHSNDVPRLFLEFEKLCKIVPNLQHEIDNTTSTFVRKVLESIVNHNEHLIDILNTALNPVLNKFVLTTIENYKNADTTGRHEIWTDSECLMINCNPFHFGELPIILCEKDKRFIDLYTLITSNHSWPMRQYVK